MFETPRKVYRNTNSHARQVIEFLHLTDEQREMFMALIPYWHMSVDDLLETVKLLDV